MQWMTPTTWASVLPPVRLQTGARLTSPVQLGCSSYDSEWPCIDALGADILQSKFEQHWDSFYNETDFAEMARLGLNVVQIPLGYWTVDSLIATDEHFLPGSIKYLKQVTSWAKAAVVAVHVVNEPQQNLDHLVSTCYPGAKKAIRTAEAELNITCGGGGTKECLSIRFMDTSWGSGDPTASIETSDHVSYDGHNWELNAASEGAEGFFQHFAAAQIWAAEQSALFECQYSTLNTAGLINLGVAENSLCTEWLADFFQRNLSLEYSDFTYGTALTGSHRLFGALRHLFSTHFAAHRPVEPAHVLCGGGCSAILDALASVLADPGDGILLALPAYPGFAASFGCRSGVEVVGVRLPPGKEASPDALDAFEVALKECKAKGQRIRAVVLCNPHNPLGFCYPRETLVAYCRFAESHGLHLISDEIYALSTYASPDLPEATPFTSLLSLDPLAEAGCAPSRIHVVYSASKDFGCNGLRLGVLVSQANPDVHIAIESSALLMKVSSAADALFSSLLLSPALPTFLALNQSRLSAAHARATSFLRTHGIPYRPTHAGHFIWVDLRAWLVEGDGTEAVEQEGALARRLWDAGVNLGRGTAYGGEAGYFRLTFTVRQDYFEAGLARLAMALGLSEVVAESVVGKKAEMGPEGGMFRLALETA